MDHSLFISDCHLCESRPSVIAAFIEFLAHTAIHADALYILGDLFEYWAGDDAINHGVHVSIINALKQLSLQGVSLYVMLGNRDFLLGNGFAQATNATILPDPTLVSLYGELTLLSHGDILCTDDVDYQHFRQEVRSDAWQTQFLNQPLSERIAYIESVRQKSDQEKSIKSMQIMDVNPTAVAELLATHGYPTLIHGHTHRPMQNQHQVDQRACTRWVLGDWYEQGSYLRVDRQGFHPYQL
ncbi:MAG: UDP-2,3-diacylglucosamine diphosphatase [Methylophilaceae bacterium]|jgi:UDP-2,3-diacylglucosamine hydrolase|nr:UDP-2,3-diacylglucosamine diphosphatase [Methylophilaceae bacterium]MDG1452969.1 UDP-2,3-diacylglucosamine diphosphatase [Methylophilaceae bacterium]